MEFPELGGRLESYVIHGECGGQIVTGALSELVTQDILPKEKNNNNGNKLQLTIVSAAASGCISTVPAQIQGKQLSETICLSYCTNL